MFYAFVAGALLFPSCKTNTSTTVQTTTDSPVVQRADTAGKMDANNMHQMDNTLMASMSSMMNKMKSVTTTGDFDVDFASMMIEHHQGAIDMSEAEIKSGTDAKVKASAQSIIVKQKEEQNKLRDYVKNTKPTKMDMGQGDTLDKTMKEMKAAMDAMKMSGNTDKDFVTMMIAHHESAIKMAKAELSFGMNASLKQMAKTMISDQSKEISEFKKL